MTIEELKQYDDLGDTSKHLYQDIKSQHPDWSHKQIMTCISVKLEADKMQIDSEELVNEILTKPLVGYIDMREVVSEKIKDMFK